MNVQRTKSNCSLCPLRGRNKVCSQLPDSGKPLFAIFGEAPDADEDRDGVPFIGGTGSVLNWALKSNDINRSGCFVGNIIACRPPNNEITSYEGQQAIPMCRGGLFEDLDRLVERGCTTILALGPAAMHAFGIEGNINQNRGSVYDYKFGGTTFKVIPTYHPSFIMSKHWRRDGGGTGDNAAAWLADFKKAKDIAKNGWEALTEDFNIEPTLDDVQKFVFEAIAHKRRIDVDTETTGLRGDHTRIVVIGLADSATHGICVPLLTLHGEKYFSLAHESRVMGFLQNLFTECELVFQNCFFDIPLLLRYGFRFNLDRVEDTILLHHTLTPETQHDLGFIVSVYGKTPYWKEAFKSKETPILEMDQLEMRRYNLRDCVVLHQVYEAMYKDLTELGMLDFYNTEVRPLLAPVMEMKLEGMKLDTKVMRKFAIETEHECDALRDELYRLGGISRELDFDSPDELRWFLFGATPGKFSKLDEFEKTNLRFKGFADRVIQLGQEARNLESSISLQMPPKELTKVQNKIARLYRDADKADSQAKRVIESQKYAEMRRLAAVRDNVKPLYVLKNYTPPLTDKGEVIATNEEGLLSFRIALNNRLRDVREFVTPVVEEMEKIELLLDWLALYSKYTTYKTIVSNFTKYQPDMDGRIRPEWKMHGTSTGRLSCSSPNLMNLPKRKDDDDEDDPKAKVRNFFVARPGWSFVSCDYVNLEVYILAYETLDPDLLSVTEKGANIHDINTRALFNIEKTDPNWKTYRAAAKVYQFGRLQYGGGDSGVFRKVMLKAPEMRLTLREFSAASARWMTLHPKYVEWKDTLEKEVTTTRQTRTAFGRLRLFFGNDEGILREALSTKIQSPGASLVNRAMRRIFDARNAAHLHSRFVCQVHDQLVMEAPDEEVEATKAIMVREMQKPFEFKGYTRVVNVDPSVGKTFGEL